LLFFQHDVIVFRVLEKRLNLAVGISLGIINRRVIIGFILRICVEC